MFEQTDTAGLGKISLREFQNGATTSPFMRALVKAVTTTNEFVFKVPTTYDYQKSTEDNYKAPLDNVCFYCRKYFGFSTYILSSFFTQGFCGQNVEIRKRLDYSYHSNYTIDRQIWQDELIAKSVLLGSPGVKQEQPWIV